jgi:ADP-heptose:LPS heptosyltransferase
MPSRFVPRLRTLARAAPRLVFRARPRSRPDSPRRILVAHHLLAGDTLMLTPLLAKLREQYPGAEVAMTVRKGLAGLYAARPYGVRALVYDPRDDSTLDRLFADRGYDLALVPGDNRYSWLAAALGAQWIVAYAGDRPAYKSWPVDELVHYAETPTAWSDMVSEMIPGPAPCPYRPGDWPAPGCRAFERPGRAYAVLHVEASTPLKHWEDGKWMALAEALSGRGLQVVWSAGPAGADAIRRIDPAERFPALGHRLDLAQLWHLVAGARLLVCPDTSVAHLGKLAFTPTVTLYGPSSARLFGKGKFWRDTPFFEATVADFPCRDQRLLFKREIEWARRCTRTLRECPRARCMEGISVEQVLRHVA